MRSTLGWTFAALGIALFPADASGAEGDVSRVAEGATEVSVSRDGSVVGIVTAAPLVSADRNDLPDVYVRAGESLRPITVPAEGQSPDGSSRGVEVSRDGSTVAFISDASNLVDGDTNGREDVFVADVASGEIRRVNVNELGGQSDVGFLLADRPSLSEDGRLVAFADSARLTGDAPLGSDSLVYRRDLEAGVTSYVAQGGTPSLSGDGKTLAYQSADDQVWAVTDDKPELISATGSGEQGNGSSGQPDVNADGSLIVFASEASDLGPGSENKGQDIFLRKRSGDPSTELVSLDDRSRPGGGSFAFPALSDDGRWVAFRAETDINGCLQQTSVEVRDRDRESTFRAARGLGNQLPDGPSGFAFGGGPSVAGGGSVVGFPSLAGNLVDGDGNGGPDGFLTELGAIEDPVVFTSKGPPRANEAADDLVFSYAVCQRAGRQEPFEFGFKTADGTATRDEDYQAAESTNSFAGTTTEVLASVPLLDDDVDEPWETVYLDGNRDTGAYLPARERGTIVDDEPDPADGPVYFERAGEILAIDPAGGTPKPIVSGTDPAVSRDGKALAFIRHTVGSPDELVIAGADGSEPNPVLVASGVGDGFGLGRPAWRPDGRRLAVTDFAGRTADIAEVTDFATDTARTLLDDAGELGDALSYSPDGSTLAFDQDGLVTALDVDTRATQTVASGVDPSYGPDGDLVYTRSDVMRILPAGGVESSFAPAKAAGEPSEFGDQRPAYSPDGAAIVFVREASGQSWIDTAPVAGGPTARLTPTSSNDLNPAWGATVTGTPPVPALSVGDAAGGEGDPLAFGVSLSAPAASDVTVTATTSAGSAGAADFTARSATVTIPAGAQSAAAFEVQTTDDTLDEDNESLTVTLSGPSGATIADGTATGTIVDDDPAPTVSIGDDSSPEGDEVVLPVTLSAASGRDVTVRVSTTPGTASSSDFTGLDNALVTIPAGQTSVSASVPTSEDTTDEPDETFTAALSSPSNATIDDGTATGTILDDDPSAAPVVSVGAPAAVSEGGLLRFPVSLDHAAATVTVNLKTEDGTAKAPGDYAAKTDTVTISAGQTQAFFDVQTARDAVEEGDETVKARITGANGASAGTLNATGTIKDDPPAKINLVAPLPVDEGGTIGFAVTLTKAAQSTVTVNVKTEDGTATAPGDYTAKTQTVTIPAGQTSAAFGVSTVDDPFDEPNETVKARVTGGNGALPGAVTTVTGTIRDNDEPPPVISIGTPAAAGEGSALRFPVTLDRAAPATVTAKLSTSDGTAVAPGDYTAQSQVTVTVPAGQTQAFFEVPTVDDGLTETDETVKARITGATGATAGTLNAIGTITDAAAITITRGGILGGQLISGTIKVKLPRGGGFIDLGDAAGLPVGTIVDATQGVIELTSAVAPRANFATASARKVQRARFRDGIFTIRQGRGSALVTLELSGPELRGCGAKASAAARKKVRRLWGDGKGRFRTKGKYAAGTVRGTKWLTEDRCGSTRVKVARGRVAVRDLVRKRTRVVRAGRSLTVRA